MESSIILLRGGFDSAYIYIKKNCAIVCCCLLLFCCCSSLAVAIIVVMIVVGEDDQERRNRRFVSFVILFYMPMYARFIVVWRQASRIFLVTTSIFHRKPFFFGSRLSCFGIILFFI